MDLPRFGPVTRTVPPVDSDWKDWTILSAQDFTISANRPHLCIDYIMLLNGTVKCNVLETRVPVEFKTGDVTIASDHLPVMAVVEW
ncbi:MAG: hypothetical protein ACI3ZP_00495 [Candidatus Cryptobacteroides sp.]